MEIHYTLTQLLFILLVLFFTATCAGVVFIMSHNKRKYGKSFFDYVDDDTIPNVPNSHNREIEKLKNIL